MDSSLSSIEERKSDKIEPIILVHGGAGNIADKYVTKQIDGVRIAARLGYEFFRKNGCIKDGVSKAVKVMENYPIFNAGRGSSVCFEGVIEMDAIIMNGQTMATGAVSCMRNVQNPIEAACMVMEESHHVLLSGQGAKRFVRENGLANTEENHLFSEEARAEIDGFHYLGRKPGVAELELEQLPTRGESVGAIGIDESGNVMAAKSTGGITGKHCGQVSAGCVPGAGVYADNEWGAVSACGHDDSVLMYGLSRRILMTVEIGGKTIYDAVKETINDFTEKTKQKAGAIAVSKTGEVAVYFNTPRMAWSYVKGNKVHFGLEPDEDCTEDL